jgi:hypothetical protein
MQHERLLSFVPFDKLRAGSVGPIANSPVADLFSEVLSKLAERKEFGSAPVPRHAVAGRMTKLRPVTTLA